ncbi:EthD domain-containing protein [Bacillus sp. B15-48]|uniref:EthD domain-containing protein n=1 Tax=Bacillus sp. B15-48 TaxID=1548601 RepID=UPI001EF17EF2|nr:EthD domain-containing protein [Bacillus sp. B15-48]
MSVLLKKNRNLSIPEFHRYWLNEHCDIAMRTPSWYSYIRKYVQTHTLHEMYEDNPPAFDGVAQVWFDSLESYQSWAQLPELSVIAEDEEKLFERDKLGGLITNEKEIQAVPDWEQKSKIKAVAVIRKAAHLSVEEYHDYWLNTHGPLVKNRPWWKHCNRYVQNHIEYDAYPSGEVPYNYNGMAEFWFTDYAEFKKWQAALAEDEVVLADEKKFVGEAEFIITSEVQKQPASQ